jgi:hypothetical protein
MFGLLVTAFIFKFHYNFNRFRITALPCFPLAPKTTITFYSCFDESHPIFILDIYNCYIFSIIFYLDLILYFIYCLVYVLFLFIYLKLISPNSLHNIFNL